MGAAAALQPGRAGPPERAPQQLRQKHDPRQHRLSFAFFGAVLHAASSPGRAADDVAASTVAWPRPPAPLRASLGLDDTGCDAPKLTPSSVHTPRRCLLRGSSVKDARPSSTCSKPRPGPICAEPLAAPRLYDLVAHEEEVGRTCARDASTSIWRASPGPLNALRADAARGVFVLEVGDGYEPRRAPSRAPRPARLGSAPCCFSRQTLKRLLGAVAPL